MKAYVATSGALFAMIVVAHILRVFAEGTSVAASPFFIATTGLAAGLAIWSWRVFRQLSRAP